MMWQTLSTYFYFLIFYIAESSEATLPEKRWCASLGISIQTPYTYSVSLIQKHRVAPILWDGGLPRRIWFILRWCVMFWFFRNTITCPHTRYQILAHLQVGYGGNIQVQALLKLDILAVVMMLFKTQFIKAFRMAFDDNYMVWCPNLKTLQVILTTRHFNPTNVSMPGCFQRQTRMPAVTPTNPQECQAQGITSPARPVEERLIVTQLIYNNLYPHTQLQLEANFQF